MTPPSTGLTNPTTSQEQPTPESVLASAQTSNRTIKPEVRGHGSSNRKRYLLLGLTTIAIVGGLAAARFLFPTTNPKYDDLIWRPVQEETVQLTIVERGELESANNAEIVCRVKAGKQTRNTTIKWLIEPGTRVVPDQIVARLDDSAQVKELEEQDIIVQKARLDWQIARDFYELTKSQNETAIKSAEVLLELSKLELEKYQKGDYEALRKDVKSRLLLAQSDLEMWNERVAWANRMVKKKFITPTQAEAEEARARSAKVALDKIVEELRVLENYTRIHETTRLKSEVVKNEALLKTAEVTARSTESQSINDRDTKRAIYEKELARQYEIEEEIRNCVLRAPQAGLVVFYESERSRRSADTSQIEVGATVHEGQKLMQIPDLNHMLVNTKVHEALVAHLKGEVRKKTGFRPSLVSGLLSPPLLTSRLIAVHALPSVMEQPEADELRSLETEKVYDGQRALVQVESYPGKLLEGRVTTVATVASKDWFSDVRVYKTYIEILDKVEKLKPGMSARVTILTDRKAENVLAIPVQSVIRGSGKNAKTYVYVKKTDGEVEKRPIVIGINNERMVEVKKGLKLGEMVAENPQIIREGGSSSKGTGSGKQQGGGQGGRGQRSR